MTNIITRNKGESLTEFLKDYTVIDIETTGLSPTNNEIIELSALKVRNDIVIEKFSALIKPKEIISGFISHLTGITDELVCESLPVEGVLPEYVKFIADDVILGHNVNFDINFIYDNLKKHNGREFSNDYIDTMRLSRKHLRLKSNSLKSLAKHYKVDLKGHHRALNDCLITFNIYQNIKMSTLSTTN